MLVLIFRALIIYVFVFIVIRLMGKRQVGELQPFELVITLIIADLACVPISELTVPVLHGIAPLIILLTLHFLITWISLKSLKFRNIISGQPKLVVTPKGIDFNTLKELNMNINDLTEALRTAGYFNFEDVNYAIVETNGNINVIPKASSSPLTSQDMQIAKEETSLPLTLISGGKIDKNNLKLAELDENFLKEQLNKYGITSFKDVTYCDINTHGKMYIQPKFSQYIAHNVNFKGGGKW